MCQKKKNVIGISTHPLLLLLLAKSLLGRWHGQHVQDEAGVSLELQQLADKLSRRYSRIHMDKREKLYPLSYSHRSYWMKCANWITITLISSADPLDNDKSTSFLQAENGSGLSMPTHKGRTTSTASWLLTCKGSMRAFLEFYHFHWKKFHQWNQLNSFHRFTLPYPRVHQKQGLEIRILVWSLRL